MQLPTPRHQRVANEVVSFFQRRDGVLAVLLIASCARGMATIESDLDIAVLVEPRVMDDLGAEWEAAKASSEAVRSLTTSSLAGALHLDLIDGRFEPVVWDDGGGPDDFEIGIGNYVAYSVPLWETGTAFAELKAKWLPYYDEPLRLQRLAMVRKAVLLDLDFIPFYVGRALYFQAFDRLYKAFREFLQGLFIARSTYPIVYIKWIKHQVCDLLSEPELYARLPGVLEVPRFESDGILGNADRLRGLVADWLPVG